MYSMSENDHMSYLRTVLQVLKDNIFFCKFCKFELRLKSVAFLCLMVHERRMDVVKSCPRPLSPIELQSIMGLSGYNSRFFEGFSSIISPLTSLTQKKCKF